jgi:hypothetical protein
MPFKSKRQMRKFFAMENREELPRGTAEEWAHETPNISKLPEKVKKSAHGSGEFTPAEIAQGYRKI